MQVLSMAEVPFASPHMRRASSGATRVRGMRQGEVQPNHPTSDYVPSKKVVVVIQKMKRVKD